MVDFGTGLLSAKPLPKSIMVQFSNAYCQTSNISYTLVGNKTVDHSDVIGALPVRAAPTTFLFMT